MCVWKEYKLSDVCDLQNGYAFKSSDYVESSNVLNIRMSNIRPNGVFDANHNIRFLPESYAQKYAGFLLKEGDLIVAMTDMAGDPKILGLPTLVQNSAGREFLMNQRVGKLYNFSPEVYVPYLCYYLSSPTMKYFYKSKGTGGLQLNISKKDILSASIPLPPIPEQQRIVAILDQAFADIEKTRANTEQNLKNARELFDSYLNQVFSQHGETEYIPANWQRCSLGEAFDVRDGTHDSPRYQASGHPFVTSKNLKNGSISFEKIKYISAVDFEKINIRSKVHEGDVLFAMIGTIGNPVVVEEEPDFAIKNVALIKAAADQNSKYLRYYLESPCVTKKMRDEAKGTTQKFVGLGYLRSFPYLAPPICEQLNVVSILDELSKKTKKLEDTYKNKLDSLDELKKSLLQKAFSGELTKSEGMVA